MARISGLGCFFLVAFRLVIGWHFAVEGVWKIRTHQIGKTSTNPSWTSEGFFREAYGPIGEWYRKRLEIGDEQALYRFKRGDAEKPIPAETEWIHYFSGFASHYSLNSDQTAAACQKVFDVQLTSLGDWLRGESAPIVKRQFVWGTADVPTTFPAQSAEFDAKQREIAQIQASEQTKFNKDVDRTRLRDTKDRCGQNRKRHRHRSTIFAPKR